MSLSAKHIRKSHKIEAANLCQVAESRIAHTVTYTRKSTEILLLVCVYASLVLSPHKLPQGMVHNHSIGCIPTEYTEEHTEECTDPQRGTQKITQRRLQRGAQKSTQRSP